MIATLKRRYTSLDRPAKTAIALTAVFSIITLVISLSHIAWRDEAQAWLLARDLSPFELIKQMSVEGHPSLWHFILMPFAKLGFPYETQFVINWVLYTIATYVIMRHSPFTNYQRVAFMCCTFMVVHSFCARSYMLMICIAVLLCALYPKRRQRPIAFALLILALCNVHSYGLGIAGAFGLVFLIDAIRDWKGMDEKQRRNSLIALGLILLGPILFVLQTSGPTSGAKSQTVMQHFEAYLNAGYKYTADAFIGSQALDIMVFWSGMFLVFLACVLRYRAMITYFLSVFITLFAMMLGMNWFWAMSLPIFVIVWIARQEYADVPSGNFPRFHNAVVRIASGLMCLLFAVTFRSSYDYAVVNLREGVNFSSSKLAADFINENGYLDYELVACDAPRASAIIPYFNRYKEVWYPDPKLGGRYGTFMDWSSPTFWEDQDADSTMHNIYANFKPGQKIMLILSRNRQIDVGYYPELSEVFSTSGSYMGGEDYILYTVSLQ